MEIVFTGNEAESLATALNLVLEKGVEMALTIGDKRFILKVHYGASSPYSATLVMTIKQIED